MFQSIYSQVALVALVLSCGFAVWKGNDAVRAGAILIVVVGVIALASLVVLSRHVLGSQSIVVCLLAAAVALRFIKPKRTLD